MRYGPFRMDHSKTPRPEAYPKLAFSQSLPFHIFADYVIEAILKFRYRVASFSKTLFRPLLVTRAQESHVVPFSVQICSARYLWLLLLLWIFLKKLLVCSGESFQESSA